MPHEEAFHSPISGFATFYLAPVSVVRSEKKVRESIFNFLGLSYC